MRKAQGLARGRSRRKQQGGDGPAQQQAAQGPGGGGGGGVKPVAVLIIENGSARLEPIPEAPSGIDKLGTALAGALERRGQKKTDDD